MLSKVTNFQRGLPEDFFMPRNLLAKVYLNLLSKKAAAENKMADLLHFQIW